MRNPKRIARYWLLVALPMAAWVAGCSQQSSIPVGAQLPPLNAVQWVRGTAPTADELRGKVVVLDAWGWWCGPCRAAAPELVKLHSEYAPQGVIFLGLTPDGPEALPQIEGFLNDAGITWPNGIGAQDTLQALGVQYFPTLIVIGADGRIAWSSDERGEIGVALDRALRAAGQD